MEFEQDFKKYKIRQQASYWLIEGMTGSGKTTLIQRCTEEKAVKNINYRYISFSSNKNTNISELVSTIFFVFFPYMYMEDITVEFLNTLKISRSLKNFLCALKKNILNEDELVDYTETLISKEIILNLDGIQINPEIIILDNVQLLNKNSVCFLFFLLKTAQKLPIIFVLSCHSYFMENSYFKRNKSQFAFRQYHLELTVDDIIKNMETQFSFTFDITNGVIEYLFPNVIVFKIYVNYVNELRESIINLSDFILTYITFRRNYIYNEYINRQFESVRKDYPSAWKVCQKIYNSGNVMTISANNQKEVGILLKFGLVRYNELNNLIPINDIYTIHYRKKNICNLNISTPIENVIWKLTNTILKEEIEECYEKLHIMRQNEEFQTINYIFEIVFENSSIDMFKKTWGEELFFLLYFEYTYAAINCNSTITGYDNLNFIYENIKGTSSPRLGVLLLELIFELINCDYNNSKYSKCKEYYKEFCKQFSVLEKKGVVEKDCKKNLFWVLSTGYILLIDSEEGFENILKKAENHRKFLLDNYPLHYINFCSQFAKTLYTKNWEIACEWQSLAYDATTNINAPESKQGLKVAFSFYFTQYIKTENACFLKKMKKLMNVAKYKIYSSYRHQLFLYCGLLYMLDSINEADTLFVKDVISLRPIRQKMKGHYYSLLSLHFIKHKNINEAQKYTEKSIETMKGLKTYEYIALHNDNVLKNVVLNKIQFKFCTSNLLEWNTFYLDPRM